MFNFFKRKNELPYEEFGYMYADSLSPSVIEPLAQSTSEWIGRPVDSERMGRDLSILSLAIFQLSLVDLKEDASGRAIGGFMKRLTKQYENFACDPNTSTIGLEYVEAAGMDFRNKTKAESFPTLVPLVVMKITGLTNNDAYWPAATEVIYSFIEKVLQTSRAGLAGTKAHARLV